MLDFRKDLYRHYVTQFKTEQVRMSAADLASYWDWCEHKYLPLLEGLDRNGPVLELGCGQGHLLQFLGNHGFSRTEGIDISEEQVGVAAGRGLNAKVGDAFDFLGSRRDAFNAIIAIDLFEHFTREELFPLLSCIHRALTPGGTLLIQAPNAQGLFPNQVAYGDLTHMTIFTPSSLEQLLVHAGFEGARFFETGPVARNLKGRVRLMLWSFVKRMVNAVRMIETGKRQDIWTENLICSCRKPAG